MCLKDAQLRMWQQMRMAPARPPATTHRVRPAQKAPAQTQVITLGQEEKTSTKQPIERILVLCMQVRVMFAYGNALTRKV